jgi:hypothetical protein
VYKIKSTFIETPCRKLARRSDDFTTDKPGELISLDGMEGAFVRYDITCWQDAAAGFDKEAIRKSFMDAGAIDADIRIIRKPRQTVRSETVLKSETLRDKLIAMATLKEETVPESILLKADALENTPVNELVGRI